MSTFELNYMPFIMQLYVLFYSVTFSNVNWQIDM